MHEMVLDSLYAVLLSPFKVSTVFTKETDYSILSLGFCTVFSVTLSLSILAYQVYVEQLTCNQGTMCDCALKCCWKVIQTAFITNHSIHARFEKKKDHQVVIASWRLSYT